MNSIDKDYGHIPPASSSIFSSQKHLFAVEYMTFQSGVSQLLSAHFLLTHKILGARYGRTVAQEVQMWDFLLQCCIKWVKVHSLCSLWVLISSLGLSILLSKHPTFGVMTDWTAPALKFHCSLCSSFGITDLASGSRTATMISWWRFVMVLWRNSTIGVAKLDFTRALKQKVIL